MRGGWDDRLLLVKIAGAFAFLALVIFLRTENRFVPS
jgi:hypothetical protein